MSSLKKPFSKDTKDALAHFMEPHHWGIPKSTARDRYSREPTNSADGVLQAADHAVVDDDLFRNQYPSCER